MKIKFIITRPGTLAAARVFTEGAEIARKAIKLQREGLARLSQKISRG